MEIYDDVLWIFLQENNKVGLITSTDNGDKTYHGDIRITREQRQETYDNIIQGFPQKDMPIQENITPNGIQVKYGYGKITELKIETYRDIHTHVHQFTGEISHTMMGEETIINLTILGYHREEIHAGKNKIILKEYMRGAYNPYTNSNMRTMTTTCRFAEGCTDEIERRINTI